MTTTTTTTWTRPLDSGLWSLVSGLWSLVSSFWSLLSVPWSLILSPHWTQCPMSDARCLMSDVWWPIDTGQWPVLAHCYCRYRWPGRNSSICPFFHFPFSHFPHHPLSGHWTRLFHTHHEETIQLSLKLFAFKFILHIGHNLLSSLSLIDEFGFNIITKML